MQIAINRHASEGVKLISSRFAIDSLDRSYSIVDSADIHASRPNCKFAPSVTYHNNAVIITKFVEAERRTMSGAPHRRTVSVGGQCTLQRKAGDRRRRRASMTATGAVGVRERGSHERATKPHEQTERRR